MGEFGTSFLFAVLFGTATLIGFAAVRFKESAADMPKDFKDLKLTPKLLTRPEMYTLGLSTYIAVLLAVYFLVTLFPEAVLLIASRGNSEVASSITELINDRYSPAFPLATALILTSPAFIKFAEPPERLLRRFAQGVAGVPRDVGYVLEVLRSADYLSGHQRLEACAHLGISEKCADSLNKCMWDEKALSPRVAYRFLARAIQFAYYLSVVRHSEVGALPEDEGRATLWQHVDFAVFANFWELAEPKLEQLRGIVKLVHEECALKVDAKSARNCVASPSQWQKEVETLQAELSALLAGSISTRTVQLDRIVDAFSLFPMELSEGERLTEGNSAGGDLRTKLVKLQGVGIRTRNKIAQNLVVACLVMLTLGLVLAPVVRKGIDGFNGSLLSGPLPPAYLLQLVSPLVDPSGDALPAKAVCQKFYELAKPSPTDGLQNPSNGDRFQGTSSTNSSRTTSSGERPAFEYCAEQLFHGEGGLSARDERRRTLLSRAAPFEWDWANFALLIAYTGLASGIGAVLAYKRRNEILSMSLVAVREKSMDPFPLLTFTHFAHMLKVTLVAVAIVSLIGQLGVLYDWASPIARQVQETQAFADAINRSEGMTFRVERVHGQAQAFLAIALGIIIMVVAGALGPAVAAVAGIAAGDRFGRWVEEGRAGLRGRLVLYSALVVALLGSVSVPILCEASVRAVQRAIYEGGILEQTIEVKSRKSSTGDETSRVCGSTFAGEKQNVARCKYVAKETAGAANPKSLRWSDVLNHASSSHEISESIAQFRFYRKAAFDQIERIATLYKSAILILLYGLVFGVIAWFAYLGRRELKQRVDPAH
jgi:hypothetical protein